MQIPDWSRSDLEKTECRPSEDRGCCVPEQCNQPAVFDFLRPGGLWTGDGYCAKHAEMLREAQWRYHNCGKSTSPP